jgi:hypothetical protein
MRHREEPFLPSQLFSRFIVAPDTDQAVLDGQDFGVLYESFVSRAQRALLSVVQTDRSLQASISLERDSAATIEVQLLDTGSGICFWRRLGNADIDVGVAVRLGLAEQRFALGPSVDLQCAQLVVACDDLDVDATDGVTLRAGAYTPSSTVLRLRVRNEEEGRLAVFWTAVGYPWAAYAAKAKEGPLRLGETVEGDTLRKLVLMFRRQRSRTEGTLMNARWSPDQLEERDRLLKLAISHGVLSRVAGHNAFEFNSDYDSLATLLSGKAQLSGRSRAFVAAYLGEKETERLLQ